MVFSLRFSGSVCSGLYWLVVRCCCEFGLLGVVGWLLGGFGTCDFAFVVLLFACCCFVTVKWCFIY